MMNMNFYFRERINLEKISLEDAIAYYRKYCSQKRIEIPQDLNGELSDGTLQIRLPLNIMDFFHSITDAKCDFTHTEIYEIVDDKNKIYKLKEPNKWLAMREAIREVFAQNVFLNMYKYTDGAYEYVHKRTLYNQEIIWLKKVCIILGLSEDYMFGLGFVKCDDMFGNRMELLTGDSEFWNNLHWKMDYISNVKEWRIVNPDFSPSEETLENVEKFAEDIDECFSYCLETKRQRKYMHLLGEDPLYWTSTLLGKQTKFEKVSKGKA